MRVACASMIMAGGILALSSTSQPCHFARSFTCEQFLSNASAVQDFTLAAMSAEGAGFHQPGIGYENVTGYTYDGHPLNYTDGTLAGTPHLFSAPSKESLHVGMLALAVDGNEPALAFVGGLANALSLLERKITTYEAFNSSFPGYGCFTPWVSVNASGVVPNPGWVGLVPGLDNGEWVWSLLAAATTLEDNGYSQLAGRYWAYFRCMADNAKIIFYGGGGNVTSVVSILNMSAPVTPGNYNRTNGGLLDDPYEGETLTVLLDLFASWPNASERELMWLVKRPMLQPVNYTMSGNVNMTVQRGWWFSAHEQWKTMLLPYLDVPIAEVVFKNCEKVRSIDASRNAIPGLFASVNDVTSGSINIPDYISATGIASVAFQPILRRDVVTPYGSWVMMLHNVSVGLCWYANMLAAPRMQGPHGSTEAIAINGTEISPLTTWDSKVTTLLSLAGGVSPLVARALKRLPDISGGTAYDRFVYVVNREMSLAFTDVVGSQQDFAVPSTAIPAVLPDWPTCP